jgi:hypothetical protein
MTLPPVSEKKFKQGICAAAKGCCLVFFLIQSLIIFGQPVEKKITPFIPPFIREGDRPQFSFLLQNNSSQDWSGSVQFNLIDRSTQQPVDGWFFNSLANQYFTIEPHDKNFIFFPLEIPYQFNKKASWTLLATAAKDSLFAAGPLTILPWIYEEEASTPLTNQRNYTVVKKIKTGSVSTSLGDMTLLQPEMPVLAPLGETMLVSIQIRRSIQKESGEIFEQWPAGTQLDSNSVLLNGKKVAATDLSIYPDHFLLRWSNRIVASTLTIQYRLRAAYPGQYHFPPALLYKATREQPITRSTFSSLTIESTPH